MTIPSQAKYIPIFSPKYSLKENKYIKIIFFEPTEQLVTVIQEDMLQFKYLEK